MITARHIIYLIMTVLLTACISSQPFPNGVIEPQPIPTPTMRAPKVGQEWVYRVRNVFNQEIVDVVTEKVVAVGQQVRIERTGIKYGRLPDEIQQPWGFILQDPHWSPPQKFLQPMPLWPEQLVSGWSGAYQNRYQVVAYPDNDYYLGLNIDALKWERVQVPAGEFNTLLYRNDIP